MGKITDFLFEIIPETPTNMAPAPKIKLKDKVDDGEIDLSLCDLQDVPVKDIATINKAHTLDLSNNKLVLLPKSFATLTNITKLDLSKNQLTELPENFGDLNRLKQLDLYRNQLTHLPISFYKLKALKWLDLKDNPLVPAITKVAGLCLDTKECIVCAKNIVAFYTQLQEKIDVEREVRDAQRQKNLLTNEKAKVTKKPKKEKKDRPKQSVNENMDDKEEEVDPIPPAVINSNKTKIKPTENLFLKLFLLFVFMFIILFTIIASKSKYTTGIEQFIVSTWSNISKTAPPSVQPILIQIESNVKYAQTKIGDTLFQLQKNKSISTNFSQYWTYFVSKISEYYNTISAKILSK